MTAEPTYTDLAVAIGRLEEGQKNVLDGVNRIELISKEALDRVGIVEQRQALTDQRLNASIEDQKAAASTAEADRRAASARKPPWTAIAALLVASYLAVRQTLGI